METHIQLADTGAETSRAVGSMSMHALAAPSTAIRVPKTAELVAAHIRRRIVRGELAEGEALPAETILMAEFTVSRPTLREAFRILESEGLITVRRGARGGARVQIPTSEVAARYAGFVLQHRGTTLADVFEARVIVEVPAAGIVAGRRDHAKAAARLENWLDEHPDADDPELAPIWFNAFNRLLVELTENETLILLTTMLESISDAATANYVKVAHEDDARLARKAHRTRLKLIDLVYEGDPVGAQELWRKHLTEQGALLMGTHGERVVDVLT
jgi:GntR family transcriptional regulator, transcriptional repressor for pyruvate dehydrogenase complex